MDIYKFKQELVKQLSRDGFNYNWQQEKLENGLHVSVGVNFFGVHNFPMQTIIVYYVSKNAIATSYVFPLSINDYEESMHESFQKAANGFINEFNTKTDGNAIAFLFNGAITIRSISYTLDFHNLPSTFLLGIKRVYKPMYDGFTRFHRFMNSNIANIISLANKWFG